MSCALCNLPLKTFPISDGQLSFCCAGCQAVYNILSAKNEQANFQEHPLFQQALQSGIISNTELIEKLHDQPSEWLKICIEIQNMWCPSCAKIIELFLFKKAGMLECTVDYSTDLAYITYDPKKIAKEEIFQTIKSLDYLPVELQNSEKSVTFTYYFKTAVAVFLSLNVMMFSYPIYAAYLDADTNGYGSLFAWLSFAASLPVLAYCGWPVFKRCFTGLKVGIYGMETLVTVGVLSSFFLSVYNLLNGSIEVYFDSMTAIISLVLVGKIVESKAKQSTKNTIHKLIRSTPKKGRLRNPDGSYSYVLLKDVLPGDVLVSLSGEKIALDGEVIEGQGTCDESLLTGEPMPKVKNILCQVIAGAVLQTGWLAYRVAKPFEGSTLHTIIQIVEQGITQKNRQKNLLDLILQWFIPFIFVVALLSLFYGSVISAISVLIIACPCAIGIAVPLSDAHLINSLASIGVIVRNRRVINSLGRETVFVFDKTGTVTHGKFEVQSGLRGLNSGELSVLKGMTGLSNHLVSQAINRAISEKPMQPDQFLEIPGRGIQAVFGDKTYYLGSSQLSKTHVNSKDSLSTVFFSRDAELLATITLADQIREESKALILHLGHPAILLSGDSEGPVKQVAMECGFASFYFSASPLEKKQIIDRLKSEGKLVCMVGDGINDAPALASADVSISVMNASDISVQVSDLLLASDQLLLIPKIFSLAKRARKITHQNLFWAFFYNLVGLGLAAFGLLNPIYSAIAMTASSIIVVLNAQRISVQKTNITTESVRSLR